MTNQSATREKNLRSGKSLWEIDDKRRPANIRLEQSVRVDVAIVGAGVSGAFMAHALAPRFDSVLVVDRRAPASGSTTASTAMLQYEIDTPLSDLSEKIGSKRAASAWQRSYRATQQLIKLVQDENIPCELGLRSSLYLTGDTLGYRAMAQECRMRNQAGIPGEFLNAAQLRDLYGIERTGAVLSSGAAGTNPVKLARGLLKRAITGGVKLHSPVEIKDVVATKHGVVLDTGEHFIEAKQVVFCTGYELLKGLPRKGTKITSSWAIATRPGVDYPRWLDELLIWEAASPYLYMRTTSDRRLIVGGEDEDIDLPSYRARSLQRKSARLIAKVKKLLPDFEFTAANKWSGAFGESEDGLPIIDAVPGMPNCYAVMGFGGNGTIYGMIAAQIVPTLIKGRADKDADIFRFR